MLLKPFFGIPSHNSKVLQVLYPLFSSLLIACSLKIMPESFKFKQFINRICQPLNSLPYSVQIVGNMLMIASPFILGILCIASFIRHAAIYDIKKENGNTVYQFHNWTNKIDHSSTYSKTNDTLYWLGSLGALLSLGFIIYNIISNSKIEDFKISGELLSADKIIIFISAILLTCALLMSSVSTIYPPLTRPKSFVEEADTTEKGKQPTPSPSPQL